jgi:hypothetical protein
MNGNEMQMTADPALIEHTRTVKSLSGRRGITIEMHSGLKYTGDVVGAGDWNTSGTNQPNRSGAYIRVSTAAGIFRLDALDIKSWS